MMATNKKRGRHISVRAYKVLNIVKKQEPSFNLWLQPEVIGFLNEQEDGFSDSLNQDCCGLTSVKVTTIKELIKRADEFDLNNQSIDCLENDIKGFDDEDYVQYICF